jgi:hypothetical protein
MFLLLDTHFILDTDASGHAIGAVLSQVQEDQERVVAYFSRTLNHAEEHTVSPERSCWPLWKR